MISENTRQQLNDPDPGQRQLAAKKLAKKATREAGALIEARLQLEGDPEVLEWLVIGAARCASTKAIKQITNLALHRIGDVRKGACDTLAEIAGTYEIALLGELAKDDQDHHVCLAAIKALEKIGTRRSESASPAIAALEIASKKHKADLSSLASQNLGNSAALAAGQVRQSINKPPTLFEDWWPPNDLSERSKAAQLGQLSKYLLAHGAEDFEVARAVQFIHRLTRNRRIRLERKAAGIAQCELCDSPFFETRSSELYFEMAHIKALKDKGRDSIENTLLLCANCHSQLDLAKDTNVIPDGDLIHVSLPNGIKRSFVISEGKPPRRLDK